MFLRKSHRNLIVQTENDFAVFEAPRRSAVLKITFSRDEWNGMEIKKHPGWQLQSAGLNSEDYHNHCLSLTREQTHLQL